MLIGIISYGMNLLRIQNAQRLFESLKDFPKLIIAQGYKPEKTNKNDIIHYFKDPLGIPLARKTLEIAFLNTNHEHIILLDDDAEILDIRKDFVLSDFSAQGISLDNVQLSRAAIQKCPFDFWQVPNEDILYYNCLKRFFGEPHKDLIFKIKHNTSNSTWRK